MDRWTTPYYGVSHLQEIAKGWQVSLEDWDTFTEVHVLQGLRRVAEDTFFCEVREGRAERLERAKRWGEKTAANLRIDARAE